MSLAIGSSVATQSVRSQTSIPYHMEKDAGEIVGRVMKGSIIGLFGAGFVGGLAGLSILTLGPRLGMSSAAATEAGITAMALIGLVGSFGTPAVMAFTTPERKFFEVTPENFDHLHGDILAQASKKGIRPSASSEGITDRLIQRYDTNANGLIDSREGSTQTHSARVLFEAADAAGTPDGTVPAGELESFIKSEYASQYRLDGFRSGEDIYTFDGFLDNHELKRFEKEFGTGGEFAR